MSNNCYFTFARSLACSSFFCWTFSSPMIYTISLYSTVNPLFICRYQCTNKCVEHTQLGHVITFLSIWIQTNCMHNSVTIKPHFSANIDNKFNMCELNVNMFNMVLLEMITKYSWNGFLRLHLMDGNGLELLLKRTLDFFSVFWMWKVYCDKELSHFLLRAVNLRQLCNFWLFFNSSICFFGRLLFDFQSNIPNPMTNQQHMHISNTCNYSIKTY